MIAQRIWEFTCDRAQQRSEIRAKNSNYHDTMKRRYDRRIQEESFSPGELVMV